MRGRLGQGGEPLEHLARFRSLRVVRIDRGLANDSVLIDEVASRHRELPLVGAITLRNVDSKLKVEAR